MRKKDQEIGPPGQAVKVKIEDLGDKIEVKEDINGVDADNIIHGIVIDDGVFKYDSISLIAGVSLIADILNERREYTFLE